MNVSSAFDDYQITVNAPAAPEAAATEDAAGDAAAPKPVVPLQVSPQPEAAPIDLLELAGGTVLKKYVPVALVAVLAAIVVALIARRGACGGR